MDRLDKVLFSMRPGGSLPTGQTTGGRDPLTQSVTCRVESAPAFRPGASSAPETTILPGGAAGSRWPLSCLCSWSWPAIYDSGGIVFTGSHGNLGYQVAVNQERQWNAYGGGVGFRVGGGMASATSSTINIGTLGVDIYDSAGKQLVWRGSATKTIDDKASPQKRQENINKAVTKLLKNFPPPVKK